MTCFSSMPFFQFPRDWFLLHSGQVLHRQWDETVTINMTKACSQIHRVVAQLTATGFRSHRLHPIQGQALDHPLFSSLQQNFHVFKHTASNKACSKCLIDDIQWHKKIHVCTPAKVKSWIQNIPYRCLRARRSIDSWLYHQTTEQF